MNQSHQILNKRNNITKYIDESTLMMQMWHCIRSKYHGQAA